MDVLSKKFITLLLVVLVVGAVQAPIHIFRIIVQFAVPHMPTPVELIIIGVYILFAFIYGFLVLSVFDFGSTLIFIKAVRDEKIELSDLVKGFKTNYTDIILANLLTFGIIMLGMMFLIIPGIILSCKLVFVKYLVMDKGLSPIAAVEESWRMTNGHAWKIFFMGFLSFFFVLFGLLMLIVGIFPAIIFIGSSFASLYQGILDQNGLYHSEEKS